MPKAKPAADYQALTQELQDLMAKLEQGELDIDQAVASYERGLQIVGLLESRLNNAENTVTELRAALAHETDG